MCIQLRTALKYSVEGASGSTVPFGLWLDGCGEGGTGCRCVMDGWRDELFVYFLRAFGGELVRRIFQQEEAAAAWRAD